MGIKGITGLYQLYNFYINDIIYIFLILSAIKLYFICVYISTIIVELHGSLLATRHETINGSRLLIPN